MKQQQHSTLQCHSHQSYGAALARSVLCCLRHLGFPSRPSAQGMTKSSMFVRAMRFCLEIKISKMESEILASPWFCLGVKFVKQILWASFQVTKATLE